MTTEDKELLLKDLCARLPYGVKCEVYNCIGVLDEVTTFYGVGVTYSNGQDTTCRIDECKPYLFPLESITEEQTEELCILCDWHDNKNDAKSILVLYQGQFVMNADVIDWLHENHFDYRGLIPMGLANDAIGKNIY